MKKAKLITYKDSGVNIDAGNAAVKLIKPLVRNTFGPEVLTDIGGFGGLFALDLKKYKQPVLVSGTDTVGTKLKIAFIMDKHDTVGIDLVAMCANDILTQGAKPLFFLDCISISKLAPEKIVQIIKGICDGCQQAECALIGGEMAEMSDFYKEGEYDLAGFIVGIVEREKVVDGRNLSPGDIIIGISSSGLHSNGYSLVRKVLLEIAKYKVTTYISDLGKTIGEELLTPTKIYVKPILSLHNRFQIRGIAHITGGGFIDNILRVLPINTKAIITKDSWDVLPIFSLIQKVSEIEDSEMYRTFNMGIGLILVVEKNDTDKIMRELAQMGEKAYIIGEIVSGDREVNLK